MKKISSWLVAILTGLVSLAAMFVFDVILAVIYYYIGKVPFLAEIMEFAGEILDIGLTVLVAVGISIYIWQFGHFVIEKINGKSIKFKDSPVLTVNSWFGIVFLTSIVFLGYNFAVLIGGAVTAYIAGFEGVSKILMFFKALKDTFSLVCTQNIIISKICSNSLFLFIIAVFADNFIDME